MSVKKHSWVPLVIGGAVLLLSLLLFAFQLLQPVENRLYDGRMVFSSAYTTVSDDIVIIQVDQNSITAASERYGWGWPWPREAYARMIDFCTAGNTGPIVLDILFSEPSVFGPEDDRIFAEAISRNGKVIIDQMAGGGPGGSVLEPLSELRAAASLVADCSSTKDGDGVIRAVALTAGESVSLSFAPLIVEEGAGFLQELERLIPRRTDGKIPLRFKGSLNRYVPYSAELLLSCIDALEAGEEPDLYPEDFEGRYVFFNYYAPGLYDICTTPISTFYPGSGVPITALDNYLTGDWITPVPGWIVAVLIVLCGVVASALALLVSRINATKRTILLGSVFFILGPVCLVPASWGLMILNYDLPVSYLLFSYLVSYIGLTFYSYIAEGRQKRFIKTAFSQYLSEDVINNLLADPSQLHLGGEKRHITVFFSDVQGFTSIGEKLSPENLTEVLNVYLTALSEIIMSTGGTIDKYEGDAIIAFWNAPATVEGHGKRAVEAALRCQEKVLEMADSLSEYVSHPLYTRIGLNTGEAIVGNMGSTSRFDYTMFGDVVNTGSRLEGLNKQFGTRVLCTAATKDHAEQFCTSAKFREIGRVRVIGKTEPVTVYEPMTEERWNAEQAGIAGFSAARSLFYEGKIQKACDAFSENHEATGDIPSSFYAERCRDLLESIKENPAILDDWQGIWVASSK